MFVCLLVYLDGLLLIHYGVWFYVFIDSLCMCISHCICASYAFILLFFPDLFYFTFSVCLNCLFSKTRKGEEREKAWNWMGKEGERISE